VHHSSAAWTKVQAGRQLTLRDAYDGLITVECVRCTSVRVLHASNREIAKIAGCDYKTVAAYRDRGELPALGGESPQDEEESEWWTVVLSIVGGLLLLWLALVACYGLHSSRPCG
jgi:hypothetical protein